MTEQQVFEVGFVDDVAYLYLTVPVLNNKAKPFRKLRICQYSLAHERVLSTERL